MPCHASAASAAAQRLQSRCCQQHAAAHQVLQPALPVLAPAVLLDATPHPHCSRDTRMSGEGCAGFQTAAGTQAIPLLLQLHAQSSTRLQLEHVPCPAASAKARPANTGSTHMKTTRGQATACCHVWTCLTVALVCPLLCRSVLQARLAALPRGVGVERGAPLDNITPQPAGQAQHMLKMQRTSWMCLSRNAQQH
jgi:hypothetical protein